MVDVASAAGIERQRADLRPWCIARLLDVDEVANRGQVSIDGGEAVWLPIVPNVYENITTVFVQLDPFETGVGKYISGPCYAEPAEVVPPPPPPPPPPGTPSVVTRTVTIRPTWSGTWRVSRSAYDRWNADRSSYGGRATLYQGSDFGSGTLVGLATYGSQITALGATAITAAVVTTKLATGSGSVQLQGAPHATKPAGAPAPSGDTATGTTSVTLTSAMREALRTGAARALVSNGAAYRGTFGTSAADGMAIRLTYTRPA